MFFDEHKKALTTMIGKRNSKGEKTQDPIAMKPEATKNEDGSMDGRHVASEDMIAAMHERSPHKLMDAMKNFIDIHMSKSDSTEEPSE